VGVLYTLYTLYETQATPGKFKIKISLRSVFFHICCLPLWLRRCAAIWQQFLGLYEYTKKERLRDAYQIFRKMKRFSVSVSVSVELRHISEGFWEFHAYLRSDPAPVYVVHRMNRVLDIQMHFNSKTMHWRERERERETDRKAGGTWTT
jgi:hypothetical protein